jgi:hypothetical protein
MVKKKRCMGITENGTRCKRIQNTQITFCHLHTYQKNYENCPICLKRCKKRFTLDCEHSFCKRCIFVWMCTKFNCPICRRSINRDLEPQTIKYGLKYKKLVMVQKKFLNISELSQEGRVLFENLGIYPGMFLHQTDWENITIPSIHIPTTEITDTIHVDNDDQHTFYTIYNTIYFFD